MCFTNISLIPLFKDHRVTFRARGGLFLPFSHSFAHLSGEGGKVSPCQKRFLPNIAYFYFLVWLLTLLPLSAKNGTVLITITAVLEVLC